MKKSNEWLGALSAVCCVLLSANFARADGGLLRSLQNVGDIQCAVFTDPTPFRAGPVDISVLLIDAKTGHALTDAYVQLKLSQTGRPALTVAATNAAATNKLGYAAKFELPAPGIWRVELTAQCAGRQVATHFDLEAAPPPPPWRAWWPWFMWPLPIILIFCYLTQARSASKENAVRA